MTSAQITIVETTDVACDDGGALGHPKVYLSLDKDGGVDCPYCGRRFERKAAAAPAAGS
jgi:uncharacterized Zn-finger protein